MTAGTATTTATSRSGTKDARLNLRLRAEEDALIRRAAAQAGQSVSDFLTSAALERAHLLLADQHDFVVERRTWEEFTRMLDEPVRPDPRLAELFARPSRLST